jgi:hypothetical protein
VSKRLQVVLSDEEYRAVARLARRQARPVSEVVRESLRRTMDEQGERPAEDRIASVLRFARFSGPTGDIDRILSDIERGRGTP